MTLTGIARCEVIDELVRRQRPFALYRLPEEKTSHFLMQAKGSVRSVATIEALDGQQGFVIAPFQVSGECPIVLIEPDVYSLEEVDFSKMSEAGELHCSSGEDSSCSNSYAACFDLFIHALREKKFDKLVLSRSVTLQKEAAFSPAAAFYQACERYAHSYIYMCYTPQTGTWLGSSPEILLSGEQEKWHTVALAGTQSLHNGELPEEWDDKNRKEQGYVASYIRKQLLSLDLHPTETAPYPVFAGALAHLKTDFRFSLTDRRSLGTLLQLLHPTPAVCGLPKEEACQFILNNEGYNRRYYSGFIGCLCPEAKTDLYVNLRCMHITDQQLTLYAGGGLLASSDLDDEWQETEKKLQTMQTVVHHQSTAL